MKYIAENEAACNEFVGHTVKARILLEVLTNKADNHFGLNPLEVNWGDVEVAKRLVNCLIESAEGVGIDVDEVFDQPF